MTVRSEMPEFKTRGKGASPHTLYKLSSQNTPYKLRLRARYFIISTYM